MHGVKYAFPARRGEVTRGVPTSYAAPPLNKEIEPGSELPPVWPFPEGQHRGVSLEPLYKTAPAAALRDPIFYELLALIDARRSGRGVLVVPTDATSIHERPESSSPRRAVGCCSLFSVTRARRRLRQRTAHHRPRRCGNSADKGCRHDRGSGLLCRIRHVVAEAARPESEGGQPGRRPDMPVAPWRLDHRRDADRRAHSRLQQPLVCASDRVGTVHWIAARAFGSSRRLISLPQSFRLSTDVATTTTAEVMILKM